MNFFIQIMLFFLLVSCGGKKTKAKALNTKGKQTSKRQSCNSSVSFDDSATVYIVIDVDTLNDLGSMDDYFSCIETQIKNSPFLKESFIKKSKHIYIELSSSAKMSNINFELINIADTSLAWTGDTDSKSKRDGFFKFINQSGYAAKWERVFSDILGSHYKWKYGAENIFYITGKELSKVQRKEFTKKIYPYSFELYLSRE